MAIDEAKLMEFLNRFVGDLGATMAAGNVVVGDRLGLYRALADEPLRPQELAERTGTAPRYVDEWLRGQAAGGYVEYDPDDRRLLADRGAGLRADRSGRSGLRAGRVPARAGRAAARAARSPRRSAPARGGLARARRRRVRRLRAVLPARVRRQPGRAAGCPRSTGWSTKLRDGARVADIGCGHGASTVLMAHGVPAVDVRRLGLPRRVDRRGPQARRRGAGVDDRVTFEVATAQTFTGGPLRPRDHVRRAARHG